MFVRVKQTQQTLKNSTAELSERIQFSLTKGLKDAGDSFDNTLRGKQEGTLVSFKEFVMG